MVSGASALPIPSAPICRQKLPAGARASHGREDSAAAGTKRARVAQSRHRQCSRTVGNDGRALPGPHSLAHLYFPLALPSPPEPSPICFLHVPKSGGSSVHAAIERALTPDALAPQRQDTSVFCDFEHFELLRPEARATLVVDPQDLHSLARHRIVAGHFSLDTLQRIAPPSSIFTVLREPRARLLSLYLYWRTLGVGDFWQPYRATEHARRPLAEFLSEPRLAPVMDNQVCRMLLHGDTRLPRSGFVAQTDVAEIASKAIERLEELGFVGVLELGESMWRGVERLLGLSLERLTVNATADPLRLTAPQRGEQLFTADALEVLEQRVAADALVYQHALTGAGLHASERRRLTERAFASQLVKLGDLAGSSAAHVSEQTEALAAMRGQLESSARVQAELQETCARLDLRDRELGELRDDLRRSEDGAARLRAWLDAVHASASWRLTAPLRVGKHGLRRVLDRYDSAPARRQPSVLARWSVNQVWGIGIALTAIIAITDAILNNNIILIPFLAGGPCCALFTGRWAWTASVGAWAFLLGVLLSIPDEIWDTYLQLDYLLIVVGASLLSVFTASLIERRQSRTVG